MAQFDASNPRPRDRGGDQRGRGTYDTNALA